jgi:hypothetical protein
MKKETKLYKENNRVGFQCILWKVRLTNIHRQDPNLKKCSRGNLK